MKFINKFILKLKNNNVKNDLNRFRKISLDKANGILIKECKENHLEYSEILKDKNKIVFKVNKKNKVMLIILHKSLVVTLNDYINFLGLYKDYNANKSYYITTGVFQQDVYNKNYSELLQKHIVLEDGLSFVVRQKGIYRYLFNFSTNKKISFRKYLPKNYA